MHCLKHEYTKIAYGGRALYGGRQQCSSSRLISRCGCGVIAAADLLLYLSLYRDGFERSILSPYSERPLAQEDYERLCRYLTRRYIPLVYPFGVNGVFLCMGLNAFFKSNGLSLRASWGVSHNRLWSAIEQMLDSDIPVILSVGPNLPRFWEKSRAMFYVKQADERYVPSVSTQAHYVTVTASDEQRLCISSWGNRYYIDKEEYRRYVNEHSMSLVSNIVLIR